MILDIDVGNTRLKWRHGSQQGFVNTAGLESSVLQHAWSGLMRPQRVRLVSVAGADIDRVVSDFCQQQWRVAAEQALTQAAQAGITNSYSTYQTMGADRWLAMLAGFNRTEGGCCVVDCGSAVTVDYVDAQGRHLGGYIAPGVRLMRKGLLSNTRQIDLPEEVRSRFDTRPGTSTAEAVGHGIELMMAALAQRVVRDCRTMLGEASSLLVTGGDGERFLDSAGAGEWCADLVLDGLAWALPDASISQGE
ncbi:MAG: type III pantothenate kinase [Halopseudomonas sp.]